MFLFLILVIKISDGILFANWVSFQWSHDSDPRSYSDSNSCFENPITELTMDNIGAKFDSAPYNIAETWTDHQIQQKYIQINEKEHNVFKVIKDGTIDYFIVDAKILGEGAHGLTREAISIVSGKTIVVKYKYSHTGEVHDEAECLKRVGMHIAHSRKIILMEKAKGTCYTDILTNRSVTDEKKIELHKKIINKLTELHEKYYIRHNDPKPEHIFIDENENIQFIDFGISDCNEEPFSSNYLKQSDIDYLNEHTYKYCDNRCGESFDKYIDSLYDSRSGFRLFVLQIITFGGIMFILSRLQD